jgi:uncharacterized protein YjdB
MQNAMNLRSSFGRLLPVLLVASLGAASCGKKPAEIRVTPAKIQLFGKARRVALSAEVVDKKGNVLPGQTLAWESSNPKVATVEATGLVKSVGPGKAQISARLNTLSGVTTVDVVDVESVSMTPGRASLVGPVGTTLQLVAEAKDGAGKPVALTPKWATSDPKVVRVTDTGLVASAGEGQATVTASFGTDVSTGCDLKVHFKEISALEISAATILLKAGETWKIVATVKDDKGALIEDPALTWSSTDPKVASVSNGVVRGESPGTATVSVAAGSRVLKATVIVN